MPRVLLESKRLGNLACEFFLAGWVGGEGVNVCLGISWGFVGNPGDFWGF